MIAWDFAGTVGWGYSSPTTRHRTSCFCKQTTTRGRTRQTSQSFCHHSPSRGCAGVGVRCGRERAGVDGVAAGDVTGRPIGFVRLELLRGIEHAVRAGGGGLLRRFDKVLATARREFLDARFRDAVRADFDGDGWEDIVVSNGHVDQKSSRGDPDRMTPSYFAMSKDEGSSKCRRPNWGRIFRAVPGAGVGNAGLERRRTDRLRDVSVAREGGAGSKRDSRINRSSRLSMQLVGTRGERNPVGAVISVKTNARTMHRLWTAGDGFLVHEPVGEAGGIVPGEVVVEVEVRWPGLGHPTRISGDRVKKSGCCASEEGRKRAVEKMGDARVGAGEGWPWGCMPRPKRTVENVLRRLICVVRRAFGLSKSSVVCDGWKPVVRLGVPKPDAQSRKSTCREAVGRSRPTSAFRYGKPRNSAQSAFPLLVFLGANIYDCEWSITEKGTLTRLTPHRVNVKPPRFKVATVCLRSVVPHRLFFRDVQSTRKSFHPIDFAQKSLTAFAPICSSLQISQECSSLTRFPHRMRPRVVVDLSTRFLRSLKSL